MRFLKSPIFLVALAEERIPAGRLSETLDLAADPNNPVIRQTCGLHSSINQCLWQLVPSPLWQGLKHMCEVARLSMSRHFDFSSCGHFSCRSVDASRVNLMTTFGLVFQCVRYKDGSNHLRNSAALATHLTTSSRGQNLFHYAVLEVIRTSRLGVWHACLSAGLYCIWRCLPI